MTFDILTKIGRRGKIGHSKSSPGPKIDPQTPKIDPQGPKMGSEGLKSVQNQVSDPPKHL